jgi:DNA topoisomerase-3
MEQVKKLSAKIVQDAIEQSREWKLEGIEIDVLPKQASRFSMGKTVAACRVCGGNMVDKGSFYGCSNYAKNRCKVTIPKKLLGKNVSAANVKKLMETGKSNTIKGFKKGEKVFDAHLVWNDAEKGFRFGFGDQTW